MEKLRLYLLLSLLIFTSACQKRTLYREFKEFKNYVWNKPDKISFEIPIKKQGQLANVIFTVRHVGQYPFDNLTIEVNLTTPKGETITLEKEINLKDDKGEFKGDVAGNLYDVEEILWKEIELKDAGTYTITVENIMQRDRIPGLVDIGIKVTLP